MFYIPFEVVESAVFHPGSYIIGNTCRDKLMRSRFVKRGGIPKSRGILRNFAMFRKGIRELWVGLKSIKWRPSIFLISPPSVRESLTEEENKYQMKCFWNLSVLFDYLNKYIFIFFLYEVVHAKFTLSFKAYFPNLLVWRWTQSSFHQKRISISVNGLARIKKFAFRWRINYIFLILSQNSRSVIPEAWKPLSWNWFDRIHLRIWALLFGIIPAWFLRPGVKSIFRFRYNFHNESFIFGWW